MVMPKTLNALQYRIMKSDGRILTVANGTLGDANTSYTYFNLLGDGYNAFAMQHVIDATKLTYEATNDDDSYSNTDDEMITTTNNRTFAGAGNWAAFGTGATATVNGGKLDVVSVAAGSG